MTQTNTPDIATEIENAEATATGQDGHVIPVDQRGPTDKRRADELTRMWERAPLFHENEKDTPLECPDCDELDQNTLESTYGQAKTRYMRAKIRPALVKSKKDGGDPLLLALANHLGEMFRAEGKAISDKLKRDGKAALQHDDLILNGVKAVTGNREALEARVMDAVDQLLFAAEIGYGCTDVNFKGQNIDGWINAVFGTSANKTAARAQAAANSAKASD